jgi:hypothetical protein
MDGVTDTDIMDVTIPSAIPLVYSFALRPGAVYKNIDVQPTTGTGADRTESDVVVLGTPSKLGMRGHFVVTKEVLDLTLQAFQVRNWSGPEAKAANLSQSRPNNTNSCNAISFPSHIIIIIAKYIV